MLDNGLLDLFDGSASESLQEFISPFFSQFNPESQIFPLVQVKPYWSLHPSLTPAVKMAAFRKAFGMD